MDVADRIFEVIVPTQDEIEIKGSQRQTVQRKVFPGYVLVKMIMDDDPGTSCAIRRASPASSAWATEPTPLGDDEVQSHHQGHGG